MVLKEWLIEKWRDFNCSLGYHDRNILSTRYIRVPNVRTKADDCYLIHSIVCTHCGKNFERIYYKERCWEVHGQDALMVKAAAEYYSSKSNNTKVK